MPFPRERSRPYLLAGGHRGFPPSPRTLLLVLALAACGPSGKAETPPVAPAAPPTVAPPAVATVAPAIPDPAPAPSPPDVAEPDLLAPDGALLPQTETHPAADSPLFRQHLRQLVAAIAADDPELARPAFFPVKAYEVVKAIVQPARDWEHRLFAAFARDIHAYHRELGAAAAGTTFARLDLHDKQARWVDRGGEGNAIGYWRVTHSRLFVTDGEGHEHGFLVTSFISWRGEWYVVHLAGFK